jgi:cell wall-associated NlpC family hydrolase
MKNLILISSVLLISGCVQKNADNTYTSTYSYHSYNQHRSAHYETPRISQNSYQINNIREHSNTNFVNNQFLSSQIEQTAKSHLGKTYEWGANGPSTFDCSGFTKAVFAQYGITIPRVSREQAKEGKIIPRNYLSKGDLIFFDSKKSSRVSHVGIYLGEGAFIHASSSKHRVVISSLNSNYYSKHFKWGRRVTEAGRYASR